MKNKISYFIVLLLSAMAVTFYACEDKDEYDYNAIEPIIFDMAGPATVAAHGLSEFPFRYTVPQRGGSQYEWTITGHGGTVVKDEEFPSIAYVTFNLANQTETATVNVTETTMGGKTTTFSKKITLNRFCLIPDNVFGNYLEYEDGYTYSPVVFSKDPTDPSGIIIQGIQGSWIPPGGKIKISLDYCTGVITLAKQGTGLMHPVYGEISLQATPNVKSYYDFDTGKFYLHLTVTVAAGSFGAWDYEFTKL